MRDYTTLPQVPKRPILTLYDQCHACEQKSDLNPFKLEQFICFLKPGLHEQHIVLNKDQGQKNNYSYTRMLSRS